MAAGKSRHQPRGDLSCTVHGFVLHPWLRAQIRVDEVVEFGGDIAVKEIVLRVLFKHYLAVMSDREELERKAYEMRERGLEWLAIARKLRMPFKPDKAKALAMAYAYRPTLEDREHLPWPI